MFQSLSRRCRKLGLTSALAIGGVLVLSGDIALTQIISSCSKSIDNQQANQFQYILDSTKLQLSDVVVNKTSESQKNSNFGKVLENQELLAQLCCLDEDGNCVSCPP